MKFNKLLELRANALISAGFHVVILGDINISHKPIDHCDPYDVSNTYQFYDTSTSTIKCFSYALTLIYFFQKFDENAGRQWLNHFLYTDQSTTKDENCHVEKEGKVIVIFALSIKF